MPRAAPARTPMMLLAGLALLLAAVGAGCSADSDGPRRTPAARVTSTPQPPPGTGEHALATSETREDSVYPATGDPLVDTLHHALDLTWRPGRRLLRARQTITLRATADADRLPLELDDALRVTALTVDGEPASFRHAGSDLVIDHPVAADRRYEVALRYRGTPEPTPAPSVRRDMAQGLGWNITAEGETWTLQEPYGAFTWYAVNDQPSDKAFYDITLTTPAPWQGVANGELVRTTRADGLTTNAWHLAEPASSYLVTVAFGDFRVTELTSTSGVPLQVWADADGPALPGETAYLPDAVDWVEARLGPYPFDTLGIVVVDNTSGMETQTMITLGDTDYSLSASTIVHEVVHQWYGDAVSPADWSDVWMNEGVAMYLQGLWEAEQEGIGLGRKMDEWATFEPGMRDTAGPPAAYDPDQFGAGNIYYGPALMWHELRAAVGEDALLEAFREWPAARDNAATDRRDYFAWLDDSLGSAFTAATGEPLEPFLRDWLLSPSTPDRS